MKSVLLAILTAFTLTAIVSPARSEISLSFFYDSLEPYGDWMETRDYGYVWQPRDVDSGWHPYTDGYWTYTDSGWTWVSYEDFGWATYHYGRWVRLTDIGWCWVPGYEWGPAWVSWRYSDDNDVVGWAPLPPRAICRPGEEIDEDVDADYDIGPSQYAFTSVRFFGSPSLRPVIYESADNVVYLGRTRNVTRVVYTGDIVYNYGPRYEIISSRCERPIERLRLERVRQWRDDDHEFRADYRGRRQGNVLRMIAPAVVPVVDDIRPRSVRTRVDWEQEERGWSDVRDQRQADDIRRKIHAEIKNHKRDERRKRERDADGKKSAAEVLRAEARRPQMRLANLQQPQVFRDTGNEDSGRDKGRVQERNKSEDRQSDKVREPGRDRRWIHDDEAWRSREGRRNDNGEDRENPDQRKDRGRRDDRGRDEANRDQQIADDRRKQEADFRRDRQQRRQQEHVEREIQPRERRDREDRDQKRVQHDRPRQENRDSERGKQKAHLGEQTQHPEQHRSNNHRLSENQDRKGRNEKDSDKKKKRDDN